MDDNEMKTTSLKIIFQIALITLLFTNISFSQSNTWQREYQGPTYYNIYGEDVCKADGENYFLLFRDYHNANRPLIYKINKYGDSLMSCNFSNCQAYTCVSSEDGGMIFTGLYTRPYTTKINSSCIQIWNNVYNQVNWMSYMYCTSPTLMDRSKSVIL